MSTDRQFLSVTEAAKRSSLSRRYLYELCSRKEIRFYRVGKRILIDSQDLESFITENVVEVVDWDEKAKEFRR